MWACTVSKRDWAARCCAALAPGITPHFRRLFFLYRVMPLILDVMRRRGRKRVRQEVSHIKPVRFAHLRRRWNPCSALRRRWAGQVVDQARRSDRFGAWRNKTRKLEYALGDACPWSADAGHRGPSSPTTCARQQPWQRALGFLALQFSPASAEAPKETCSGSSHGREVFLTSVPGGMKHCRRFLTGRRARTQTVPHPRGCFQRWGRWVMWTRWTNLPANCSGLDRILFFVWRHAGRAGAGSQTARCRVKYSA